MHVLLKTLSWYFRLSVVAVSAILLLTLLFTGMVFFIKDPALNSKISSVYLLTVGMAIPLIGSVFAMLASAPQMLQLRRYFYTQWLALGLMTLLTGMPWLVVSYQAGTIPTGILVLVEFVLISVLAMYQRFWSSVLGLLFVLGLFGVPHINVAWWRISNPIFHLLLLPSIILLLTVQWRRRTFLSPKSAIILDRRGVERTQNSYLARLWANGLDWLLPKVISQRCSERVNLALAPRSSLGFISLLLPSLALLAWSLVFAEIGPLWLLRFTLIAAGLVVLNIIEFRPRAAAQLRTIAVTLAGKGIVLGTLVSTRITRIATLATVVTALPTLAYIALYQAGAKEAGVAVAVVALHALTLTPALYRLPHSLLFSLLVPLVYLASLLLSFHLFLGLLGAERYTAMALLLLPFALVAVIGARWWRLLPLERWLLPLKG